MYTNLKPLLAYLHSSPIQYSTLPPGQILNSPFSEFFKLLSRISSSLDLTLLDYSASLLQKGFFIDIPSEPLLAYLQSSLTQPLGTSHQKR